MGTYTIPNVVERTPQGERSYDVFSRLLSERIIFLGTEIDDGVANVVIAQSSIWESSNPESEIAIYINSPGGSFTSLMAIYDTMTFVQAPISTFCVGQAASTAAVLLAGGDPGRRFVLEHACVLLGQPASGGRQGDGVRPRPPGQGDAPYPRPGRGRPLRHTHHDVRTLRADMDRDKVFTAQEAVAYGLADEVLSPTARDGLKTGPPPGPASAATSAGQALAGRSGSGGEAHAVVVRGRRGAMAGGPHLGEAG